MEVFFVCGLDGRIELALVAKGNECKSFGLPGITVCDDFNPFDGAEFYEEV